MSSKPTPRKIVAVIGSGGREHALAWKLSLSPEIKKLILVPGNDGMQASEGGVEVERWSWDDGEFEKLAAQLREARVDLAVIGPDDPLAQGIVDAFRAEGLLTFGPSRAAAQIESSKTLAKEVMKAAGVPTAQYISSENLDEVKRYLKNVPWPPHSKGWVIKADGLALGKGVDVCTHLEDALRSADRLFAVSKKLLVEERLLGREISWMVLCDGKRGALMEPARDYKRIFDGDEGANTGGMGCFCPVANANTAGFFDRVQKTIIQPTLDEMNRRGTPFSGLLYAGLIFDEETDALKVIEFNARFGDPECQVLMPRVNGDLLPWLEASARNDFGDLPDRVPFINGSSFYVVGAAPGYPENAKKGLRIKGLGDFSFRLGQPHIDLFIAGAKYDETSEQWTTSGGRVLGAVSVGEDFESARSLAYQRIKAIHWEGIQVRGDIGS